jgi:hypothetical protein
MVMTIVRRIKLGEVKKENTAFPALALCVMMSLRDGYGTVTNLPSRGWRMYGRTGRRRYLLMESQTEDEDKAISLSRLRLCDGSEGKKPG